MFLTNTPFSLYDLRILLSMEETFILTGIAVLLAGTALGLLGAWLVSKAEDKSKK